MYLVWLGVVLIAAKWLELGPLAELSWWWILAPLAGAFAWFEVFEPMFGLDRRRKQDDEQEQRRKDRVAAQFAGPDKGRRRAP